MVLTSMGQHSSRGTFAHKCIRCDESFLSSELVEQHLLESHVNSMDIIKDEDDDDAEDYGRPNDDQGGDGSEDDLPLLSMKTNKEDDDAKSAKTKKTSLMSFKKKKEGDRTEDPLHGQGDFNVGENKKKRMNLPRRERSAKTFANAAFADEEDEEYREQEESPKKRKLLSSPSKNRGKKMKPSNNSNSVEMVVTPELAGYDLHGQVSYHCLKIIDSK